MMKKENLNLITEPLMEWFQKGARVLPWRENPLPYYVWISEIMLQQTRVEAVKPYFARFVQALPQVGDLAVCPEERLLKLWEGLGYYNRVRNMQKAARILVEQYDGQLPADFEKLLTLPGIGRYTAGAIASIAYGIPVPAVDGNVLRVISRIVENDQDITRQSVKNEIEVMVQAIEPEDFPGAFNQSLMELGAMVCLPNGAPLCGQCPVAELCQARQHGRLDEIPKKKEKQKRKIEDRTVLVIRDDIRTVIRKRPPKGLLAGLYELPNLEGHLSQKEVLTYLETQQFHPLQIHPLKEAKHIFSHIEWHMTGYMVLVEDMEKKASDTAGEPQMLIVEPARTEAEYPIPAAFAAYTSYLQIRLGQEKYDGAHPILY